MRFPGRAAQEFEMQAGTREIGTLAVYCGMQTGMRCLGRRKRGWRESSNRRRFGRTGPSIIHGNGRKMKKGRKGKMKKATALLYLCCLLMSLSSDLSLCLLQRPPHVAVVAAFESFLLTMRTERGVGLPLRKARASVVNCLR